MAHKIPGTKVTAIRVTDEQEARIKTVRAAISQRAIGASISYTAAVARIIDRGLDAVEAEFGITSKPAAKKTKAA